MKVSSLRFASQFPYVPAAQPVAVDLENQINQGQQAVAQQPVPAIQAQLAQELQEAQGHDQPIIRHHQRRNAIVDLPQIINGPQADVLNRQGQDVAPEGRGAQQ